MSGQQPDDEEWFNDRGHVYDRNNHTVALVLGQDSDARLILAPKKMHAAPQ